MIEFTVYDKISGRILSTGYCPEDHYEFQGAGNSIAKGNYPNNKYYWENGFKEIPVKPNFGFYNFDYDTKQWELDSKQTIQKNKEKRRSLLIGSDWTQLPDVTLTQTQKETWVIYRQQLRDMTEQDYLNSNFPIIP